MLRILFLVIVGFHGLIHLMGFAKAFGYAELEALGQYISRSRGLLWLLAALLISSSALLYGLRQELWWLPGLAGAVLSQVLLFLHWQDAKFGTIPNVLLLVVGLVGFGTWHFDRLVRSDLAALWPADGPATGTVIAAGQINALPGPVQRWLRAVGVEGEPRLRRLHLRQQGAMRTSADAKWMKFEARQWFTASPPAFLWHADVGVGSLLRLSGKDCLQDGHGHMLIKAFGLLPIVNSRGPEIDQGTMLRYLAEMVWFPSAALEKYIRWEAIDEEHARAVMSINGRSVDGVFTFNDQGLVTAFEGRRYYDRPGGASLETWHIDMPADGYREFNGMRIPAHCEVSWKLEGGDFLWLKLEIVG